MDPSPNWPRPFTSMAFRLPSDFRKKLWSEPAVNAKALAIISVKPQQEPMKKGPLHLLSFALYAKIASFTKFLCLTPSCRLLVEDLGEILVCNN